MAKVALIGLGRMGRGIAAGLLAGGHSLAVFNRTAARAEAFAAMGARIASSPAQACVDADVIVSIVADDAASRAVWTEGEGILSAQLNPGAFAIECSTLSHDWVLELAARAAQAGLRYIDSPVTGLPESAAAGKLTLLVGATAADLDAARPVLAAFADRIFHFGGVGAGTAYKLIINLLGAVQIASAAESMALAERAGLDLGTVADAIATGQAASPQVVRNTRRMVDGQHARDVIFTPQLRLKDVNYALGLARKLGLGSPFGSQAAADFQRLCDLGYADANESIVQVVAQARVLPDAG